MLPKPNPHFLKSLELPPGATGKHQPLGVAFQALHISRPSVLLQPHSPGFLSIPASKTGVLGVLQIEP